MKLRLCAQAFCLLLLTHSALAKPFLYKLTSKGPGFTQLCSATQIKYQGQCYLLTNYHCTKNSTSLTLTMPKREQPSSQYNSSWQRIDLKSFFPQLPGPLSVTSKRFDSDKDLALLSPKDSTSSTFFQRTCENLSEAEFIEDRPLAGGAKTLMALGQLDGKQVATYSNNISWNDGYGNSEVYIYPNTKKDNFLKIYSLNILPGMSGGAVINTGNRLLGLIARFIPFHEISLVVPASSLKSFLMDSSTAPQSTHGLQASAGWRAIHKLGSTQYAGDNAHADGGDNAHADGGGRDKRITSSHILDPFLPPSEGVKLPSGKTLLAFKKKTGVFSRSYFQIDGKDDYFLKFLPAKKEGKIKEEYFRERDGFPHEDIREDILERLEGSYKAFTSIQVAGSHRIYVEDQSSPMGWRPFAEGSALNWATIDEGDQEIKLQLWGHDIVNYNNHLDYLGRFQAKEYNFSLNFNDNYKTIIAKNAQWGNLRCKNENFYKLVCKGRKFAFSLSFSGSEKRSLDLRIVSVQFVPKLGKRVIDFFHGTLRGVD